MAAKVRAQYHQRFIPQAIDTGEHFFAEDSDRPAFIWTTGAWLIWDHLATQGPAEVKRLERAIERGLIGWHALPFTTHSELMSPELFRAGLSYAQELDRRFNRTTSAAKMTDVPGHNARHRAAAGRGRGAFPASGGQWRVAATRRAGTVPLARPGWVRDRGDVPAFLRRDALPRGIRRGHRFRPHQRQYGTAKRAAGGRHLSRARPQPARRDGHRLDPRCLWRDRLGATGGAAGGGDGAGRQLDLRQRQRPRQDGPVPGAAAAPRCVRRRGADAGPPRLRPWPGAGRRAHLRRRHQIVSARRDGVGPAGFRGAAGHRPSICLHRSLVGRAARLSRCGGRRAR